MSPKKLSETKDNNSFNEFLTSIEDLVRKIKVYYKRKNSLKEKKITLLNNLQKKKQNIRNNIKKKNIIKFKFFKKNKIIPINDNKFKLNNSINIIGLSKNKMKKSNVGFSKLKIIKLNKFKKNIKKDIKKFNNNIKKIDNENIDYKTKSNTINPIITRAKDIDSINSTKKEIIIDQPKSPTNIFKYNNKYSIHFGISNYDNWSKLPNAENDATALNDLFKKKFNFKSKLIKGVEVTKNNIEKEILSMKNILSKNDLLVVTFSGHGTSIHFDNCIGGFIVPQNASKETILSELVSMKSLSEWANWLPSIHIVFLLDCCFSGLSQLRGGHRKSIYTISHLLNLKCRYVINAGNGNQKVHDGVGKHSPFVQAILDSPVIDDEQCSIKDLAEDIVHKVSELSNFRQTPVSGTLQGDHGGCAFLAL